MFFFVEFTSTREWFSVLDESIIIAYITQRAFKDARNPLFLRDLQDPFPADLSGQLQSNFTNTWQRAPVPVKTTTVSFF